MQQIYTVGIYFFSFLVKVYSFLNGKTRKIVDGHVFTWEILENVDSEAFIWFHVASLGEFEQGRPLIESLKSQYPNQKVLITFRKKGFWVNLHQEFFSHGSFKIVKALCDN